MNSTACHVFRLNIKKITASIAGGFSLVEVLIGMVVIAISVAGTTGLFNVAMTSIRQTGEKAGQGSAVEADVARIGELAVSYNACTNPTGSFDACPGQDVANSFYYFPDDLNDRGAFFDACKSTAGSHITDAFIAAINQLPPPGSGVTRLPAEREPNAAGDNHVVVVRWQAAELNFSRVIKTTPVLSSWCN
jgi:prepilin-type N-terminal cleavage/methylation domain-containing protein